MTFDGFGRPAPLHQGISIFFVSFQVFSALRESELDRRTKRTKTSKWWIRFILSQSVIESYFRGAADGTRLHLWMLISWSTHHGFCYFRHVALPRPLRDALRNYLSNTSTTWHAYQTQLSRKYLLPFGMRMNWFIHKIKGRDYFFITFVINY